MIRPHIVRSFIPLFAMGLALAACSPQSGGSGAGSPVATEWKEGYGGDSIALEAVRMIEKTCATVKRIRPNLLKDAMETKVEVAESICNLLTPGALVIESVKQPKVNGTDKDAANYPEAQPRRLQVKASYWSGLTATAEAREKLIVHELLPLIGIEDTDYVRSTRLLIAMQAARGMVPEISCDAHRIEASLAGSDLMLARLLGRELGLLRCQISIEILSSFKSEKSEDGAVRNEVSQALALAAFIGAAQAADHAAATQYEDFYIDVVTALPMALRNWSPGLCAQDVVSKGPNANLCGGLMAFLFGATPDQKRAILATEGTLIDFDRATMNFLNRMAKTPRLMSAFIYNGRVDQDLAKAAIRTQNWLPLLFLGQVHRSLHLPGRASEVIVQGFSWAQVLQDGAAVSGNSEDRRLRQDYGNCTIPDLRTFVESILEGGTSKLRCEQAFSV